MTRGDLDDAAPPSPAPLAPIAAAFTDFAPRETAAAIGLALLGLLVGGLFPLLLGALAAAGRLSAGELGVAATAETLVLGLTTAACAAWLPPRRLRAVGAAAALALALADAGSAGLSHLPLLGMRALAGVPEGVLLWLGIGLIARTRVPERWAGILTLGQPASQALAAAALGAIILPDFGVDGAFRALAALCALVAMGALALPHAYPPLADGDEAGGSLPPLGLLALAGMAAYLGAVTLVSVFLGPLSAARGLSAATLARTVTAGLAGETLGALLATVTSGRVRPIRSLVVAAPVAMAAIAALSLSRTGPVFAAAAAAFGFAAFYGMPALVALAIQADPTRRSAMQSGAAQLLGSAAAPLAGAGAAGAGLGVVMALAGAMVAGALGAFALVARSAPTPTGGMRPDETRADRGRGTGGDRAR